MPDRTSAVPSLDFHPMFPDVLTVGVPRGWKARLRNRAEAEGVSVSALVRDAIGKLARPVRKGEKAKACAKVRT
ncbi:ribbon-helix-helix protein, CopG family [Lichenihabitans sp. Uapishka_5]|uniref:ribbon-helix-helix protein, CopG family n=1 Tax=Lichenihabitans sp. Uapishka_5 TaxID=3037302 RepID=UPI0029E7D638|nr:ribbon-helix-helix protein, CopG family [Lichenihabitans sp. Uapishka_5]MDX7953388.1 ribbon-helix-helix protein, CopG family [Lichenihabitans sp. Uapishka_5]